MAAQVMGSSEVYGDRELDVHIDWTKGSVDVASVFDVTADSNATFTINTTAGNGLRLFTTDTNAELDLISQRLFGFTGSQIRQSYFKAEGIFKMARNADLDMGFTFGLSDGAAGDLLVDTTTAVCTTFDGIVFTLAHDSLSLGATVSNATVQTSYTGLATIVEATAFKLGIEVLDVVTRDAGTTYVATIRLYFNDTLVKSIEGYSVASWGPMPLVIAQKAVSGNDQILYSEMLHLKYLPGAGDATALTGTAIPA